MELWARTGWVLGDVGYFDKNIVVLQLRDRVVFDVGTFLLQCPSAKCAVHGGGELTES